MCKLHYAARQRAISRGDEREFAEWMKAQRSYDRLPVCRVRACDREGAPGFSDLCLHHVLKWKKHRDASGVSRQDRSAYEHWLERAVPYMNAAMFSLAPLEPLARLEVLYCLQRRDARGQRVPPRQVRSVIKTLGGLPSLAFGGDAVPDASTQTTTQERAWLAEVEWMLRTAVDEFQGISPIEKTRWDLRAVSEVIPSLGITNGLSFNNGGGLDFAEVEQEWLRGTLMHWARTTAPDRQKLRKRHRAVVIASQALHLRPGGGNDPTTLQYADMTAVVDAYNRVLRPDGKPASSQHCAMFLNHFSELLDFARYEGVPEVLSPRFVRHKEHRIKVMEENEDEIGKALPDIVVRQLDHHANLIGEDLVYGRRYPREAMQLMFRTAYVILRDTGRRPLEVAALSVDCLEFDQGLYQLIWDNTKGRRLRRRLPVYSETIEAIKEWRQVRAELDLPRNSALALFPAIGERHKNLTSANLSNAIRQWVDSIPVLLSDEVGPDGAPLPFDRSRVFPYAFRHSFCQRYADAGVPLHVLQDLMDHKDPKVTGTYYRVSNKMKREAMDLLRLHSTDRNGKPAPIASARAYEVQSVAVPYGNCIEPSNVKAGGQSCPIRFQCSGCTPFYRPDPSHLPAIEDQVRGLRAKVEIAQTMGVEEWTVKGMEAELAGYLSVIDTMKAKLEQLPDEERREVEEASKVLRRMRAGGAGGGPVALPMPTLRRDGVEDQ